MGISENTLTSVPDIRDFMFGGQAEFTLHSLVSNNHFTYRVISDSRDPLAEVRFVFFLNGNNNEDDWSYAGVLKRFDKLQFERTAKSPSQNAPVMKAIGWFVHMLNKNTVAADQMEFMHSGRCSACGRKLTTPESIRTGLGPVCRSKL